MIGMKIYFVYLITNKPGGVIYVGMTNDLRKRLDEHRSGLGSKFTSKYKLYRLVYFEEFRDVNDAIRREKQIKSGSRTKKIELIEMENPEWRDLMD